MKTLLSLLCFASALVFSGCAGQLDLSHQGDPNRVATGNVEIDGGIQLPPDAIVVVRVMESIGQKEPSPAAVLGEASAAAPLRLPPKILGEQTIRNPGQSPIPFRVEYTADDSQLTPGLNIEARISYGGKVRLMNLNSYSITLSNASDPHTIAVDRVDR